MTKIKPKNKQINQKQVRYQTKKLYNQKLMQYFANLIKEVIIIYYFILFSIIDVESKFVACDFMYLAFNKFRKLLTKSFILMVIENCLQLIGKSHVSDLEYFHNREYFSVLIKNLIQLLYKPELKIILEKIAPKVVQTVKTLKDNEIKLEADKKSST